MIKRFTRQLFRGAIASASILFACSSASYADAVDTLLPLCAGCHGTTGIAPAPQWPNIAGQKADYLAAQLQLFRSGERVAASMNGLASMLTDDAIDSLATYYAKQTPASGGNASAVADNSDGGHVRARCISCHGKDGETVNSEWPNLAGQNADYLAKTLQDYRSGARPNAVMHVIAEELTDAEISAVANYYSQH